MLSAMKDRVAGLADKFKALPADQKTPLVLWIVFTIALVASYWNMLGMAVDAWTQPQYSHGYLVPLFTVVLLMLRREPFGPVSNRERWIGLGALAVFMAIRVYACLVRMAAIDMYTFVPVMLAVLMLLGGWKLLRWAGPAVFFLIFMFPLSAKMERVFLDPLQRIAMAGGTYALQTTGIETYAVANHIYIRDKDDVQQDVSVAEACSGLNMLTIFSAMSVALVLLMPGAMWEKIVIVASAIPIAIFVNVCRIVVYGVLRYYNENAAVVFHDYLAAFFMMPLAMGMLYLEYIILKNLVIDEQKAAPVPVFGFGPPVKAQRPTSPGRA
jgi:exosortase